MEFEIKTIADMDRATYNPRVDLQPDDEDYQTIKHSLEEHGLVQPIVWNRRTNTVVSGHQRLTVLEAAGETEVTVSVVDLDEIKEKELNVVLNKVEGKWDDKKLSALIAELGSEAEHTGFTAAEIETINSGLQSYFADAADRDDDPLPEQDETFLLSLDFVKADEKDLKAFIKKNGEEPLVAAIIEYVNLHKE